MTIEELNTLCQNTLIDQLDIQFTALGESFIAARMPVNEKTRQPFGYLHGGATISLAETLASAGSAAIMKGKALVFGAAVSAHHLKSVENGWVFGKALLIHLGKSTHVWEVNIINQDEELLSKCTITVSIKPRK